jgi:hypothetical protein
LLNPVPEFRVQSSGFKVQSSGFKVQGSRFKVPGSKFKVPGSKFRVPGSKFKVQSLVAREVFRCRKKGDCPWIFPDSNRL